MWQCGPTERGRRGAKDQEKEEKEGKVFRLISCGVTVAYAFFVYIKLLQNALNRH